MTGPWGVLATTLAIQALVSMAVLAVPAMAPALGEALRASPGLIGVYIAILYVGAMVASMASGPLVVRRGAIRVRQLGLLAGALVPPLVVMGGVAAALWSVAAGCIACVLLAQVTRGPLDADREHGHAIDIARLVAPVLLVARQPTLARLAACSLVFSALRWRWWPA
ncbi:MAG: hypothetical protein Q8S02_05340 [Hydrogenophaga sp.]|nr:hypothetical protein [Hydrogenophaga sp.]